jgi:uncharacterized protein (TIGR03437 family)
MSPPQTVMTATGPAIVHSSDFTLVSPSKPAVAGEILSLIATSLGPAVSEVDLGLPFPSSPLATVNSPITVTVNGEAATVLAAVGYPGAVDGYQVNFRMPSDVQKRECYDSTHRGMDSRSTCQHRCSVALETKEHRPRNKSDSYDPLSGE